MTRRDRLSRVAPVLVTAVIVLSLVLDGVL